MFVVIVQRLSLKTGHCLILWGIGPFLRITVVQSAECIFTANIFSFYFLPIFVLSAVAVVAVAVAPVVAVAVL